MSQWKCLTMTAMVKSSAQIEPFQVSKGNEICFMLFFCNCPQNIKSFLYFFIAVRDSPALDMYTDL